MDIIKKVDSKLLGRVEIYGKMGHAEKATPSTREVKDMVCKKESCKPELVVVKGIKGHYGGGSSDIIAYVYKSKEDLEKLEGKPKEEPKKEEPKQEAPKEEPKPEEKKDDKETKAEEQGAK